MTAVPALVRAVRYGDVRGTDTAALAAVVAALTARVCAGLPAAVSSLADDAAAELRGALDGMQAALSLHAQHERGRDTRDRWLAALGLLAGRADVHGLLAGRAVRLLAEAGVLPGPSRPRRFAPTCRSGCPRPARRPGRRGSCPAAACCWCTTGTCSASWTTGWPAWPARTSLDVLPLLRRTFGEFAAAERANIGQAVRQLTGSVDTGAGDPTLGRGRRSTPSRAAGALRTVAAILGGAR